MNEKFIADVHLGKLAKLLRMLGFDTVYSNSFTNAELLNIAGEENRILLSRNIAFEKNDVQFLHIHYEEPEEQLKQVVQYFQLKNNFFPFTRCIVCNGLLEVISKESISDRAEKNTFKYFNDFWQCNTCRRIYWKGSHYNRMIALIEKIRTET